MEDDQGNRGAPSPSAVRRLAGAERAMGAFSAGDASSAARWLASAERAMGALSAGPGLPGRAGASLDEHLLLIRRDFATKDDLRELRAEVEKSRLEARAEIERSRLEARAELDALQARVDDLRAEFDAAIRRLVFWSAGTTFLGMSGLTAAFLLFF